MQPKQAAILARCNTAVDAHNDGGTGRASDYSWRVGKVTLNPCMWPAQELRSRAGTKVGKSMGDLCSVRLSVILIVLPFVDCKDISVQ